MIKPIKKMIKSTAAILTIRNKMNLKKDLRG